MTKPLTAVEAVAEAWADAHLEDPWTLSSDMDAAASLIKRIEKRGYELVAEDTASEWLGCHAGKDGDCAWSHCPQQRDDEPYKTGRACPLYVAFPDGVDPDDYPPRAPEKPTSSADVLDEIAKDAIATGRGFARVAPGEISKPELLPMDQAPRDGTWVLAYQIYVPVIGGPSYIPPLPVQWSRAFAGTWVDRTGCHYMTSNFRGYLPIPEVR